MASAKVPTDEERRIIRENGLNPEEYAVTFRTDTEIYMLCYKTRDQVVDGYTVAVDEADLILKTVPWTVVLHMEDAPSKVLALITEHIRKLPAPGTAYQVKKKETQTQMFRMVKEEILDFHTDEKPRRIIRRTELTLGGFPLWQAATEKTVVKVYPEYEDILCLDNTVIRLVGDNVLFADDMTSRAYILCTPAKEVKQQEQLTHLSKIQWVAE